MFAVIPLDHSNAIRFERLAPFEVRHVLRDLSALGRVHAFGATLLGRPMGLGLAVQGWAGKGAFAGAAPETGSARLLALTVARSHRRLGVGRMLLEALETALRKTGAESIAANYAISAPDGLIAAEALFRAAGFGAPELTMLQCRVGHAFLDAPIMRDQLELPPEYEIVDWVDLTQQDREWIAERQQREPWYPPALDPFHFEPDLEVLNSLALRYGGEIVGWLITRRTSPTTMYYRSLFVRADLARLGRGLALICESVRRHHVLVGSTYGYGEWSTPAAMPAMLRFIRRHLEPHGTVVTEQRVVRKNLQSASQQLQTPVRVKRRAVSSTALLSEAECANTVTWVNEAREHWTERFDALPFHTLGAVAVIDGNETGGQYERECEKTNSLLQGELAWLYERLHATLERVLGAPVQQRVGWALPSIQVWSASRGSHLPLAAIRCNSTPQFLEPREPAPFRPISFCICLTTNEMAPGLTIWDLGYDETIGLDTEETARLLDAVPRQFHSLDPGSILVFASDSYQQRSPLADLATGKQRVTIEGQAVYFQEKWHVHG